MVSDWFVADGDAGPPQPPDSVEASAARQRAGVGGRRVAERLGMTVLRVRIALLFFLFYTNVAEPKPPQGTKLI